MSIQVVCPNCKGTMEAKEELLGTQARCPFCMQPCEVKRPPAPSNNSSKKKGPERDKLNSGERLNSGESSYAKPAVVPPVVAAPSPAPSPPVPPPAPKIPVAVAVSSFSAQRLDAGRREPRRETEEEHVPDKGADGPTGMVLAPAAGGHRQKRHIFMVMLASVIRRGNPTDVSVVLSGLAAVLIAWLFYHFFVPTAPIIGKIDKIDAKNSTLTLVTGVDKVFEKDKIVEKDKTLELAITDTTVLTEADGKALDGGLKNTKLIKGTRLAYETSTKDGKTQLVRARFIGSRSDRVRELLSERGWVQYATVFFTIWASVMLFAKFWKIAHQRSSLTFNLLPVDQAKITPGNVDLVISHIEKLPVNPRKNFLVNRLLMALENFKARKNVGEVAGVLKSQAETDGNMVDSSYAMLKVLIWVVPILGFLGTVIGISAAVDGFTGDVANAGEFSGVQNALKKVTDGLATAFDTTYLGLILSIVIMFPTNWIQKMEDDLLSTIDQYCDENLLSRLSTEEPTKVVETASVDKDLQKEMHSVANVLQEWQKRLENLETALFERVVDTLGDIRKEMAANHRAANRAVPEEVV